MLFSDMIATVRDGQAYPVLILVVMDAVLWHPLTRSQLSTILHVLILVVMDAVLWLRVQLFEDADIVKS